VKETQIGKIVHGFCKQDGEIGVYAKTLVNTWKLLVKKAIKLKAKAIQGQGHDDSASEGEGNSDEEEEEDKEKETEDEQQCGDEGEYLTTFVRVKVSFYNGQNSTQVVTIVHMINGNRLTFYNGQNSTQVVTIVHMINGNRLKTRGTRFKLWFDVQRSST
jgi:hypothetical protein